MLRPLGTANAVIKPALRAVRGVSGAHAMLLLATTAQGPHMGGIPSKNVEHEAAEGGLNIGTKS